LEDERFNHQCEVAKGILEEECGSMISHFFRGIRERKKLEKKQRQAYELERQTNIDIE
ncbi:MAG: tRNA-specific adenosine deaminase, partial [Bacillota bacterium]|nr:tRNA-specific adenosine deaminase [Bacillota bacterium]